MNELDRYQPDDWSRDGVTTVRRSSERRFRKRAKENWLAVAAKATIIGFAFAALTPAAPPASASDLVQHAAFADVGRQAKPHSELQNIEPNYWPKLVKFLDQFPRDESVKANFDPDPFT